jgi:hypothetical protein
LLRWSRSRCDNGYQAIDEALEEERDQPMGGEAMSGRVDKATEEGFRIGLETLSDADLAKQCEHYIWLSAYAANNPRSAYHWKCDATYDECKRRGKLDIYTKAHTSELAKVRNEPPGRKFY